jgi:hypothetical protein
MNHTVESYYSSFTFKIISFIFSIMNKNCGVSPSSLTTRYSIISESNSIPSKKVLASNLYNITHLLKRIRSERTSQNSKITSCIPMNTIHQLSQHHESEASEQKLSFTDNSIPLKDTHQQEQIVTKTLICRSNNATQSPLIRFKQKGIMFNTDQSNKNSRTKNPKPHNRFFK